MPHMDYLVLVALGNYELCSTDHSAHASDMRGRYWLSCAADATVCFQWILGQPIFQDTPRASLSWLVGEQSRPPCEATLKKSLVAFIFTPAVARSFYYFIFVRPHRSLSVKGLGRHHPMLFMTMAWIEVRICLNCGELVRIVTSLRGEGGRSHVPPVALSLLQDLNTPQISRCLPLMTMAITCEN